MAYAEWQDRDLLHHKLQVPPLPSFDPIYFAPPSPLPFVTTPHYPITPPIFHEKMDGMAAVD